MNFIASLQGIPSKQGTRTANKKVNVDLVRYQEMISPLNNFKGLSVYVDICMTPTCVG